MFTEENIKNAVQSLCELFDESERWMLDDDYFVLEGISNKCLAEALEDRMEAVYEYTAVSHTEDHLDYRGKYLFDQRAVRMIAFENYATEDDHYGMEYDSELWLLEDMSFAQVSCFRTLIEQDDYLGALTEYRTVKKKIETSDDLFFTIEELLEELDCICTLAMSYQE